MCHVAAVKRLPVFHHSADYISISFGIFEPFENQIPFEPVMMGNWARGGGGGGRRRLPVFHHSADYIFYFLWDL